MRAHLSRSLLPALGSVILTVVMVVAGSTPHHTSAQGLLALSASGNAQQYWVGLDARPRGTGQNAFTAASFSVKRGQPVILRARTNAPLSNRFHLKIVDLGRKQPNGLNVVVVECAYSPCSRGVYSSRPGVYRLQAFVIDTTLKAGQVGRVLGQSGVLTLAWTPTGRPPAQPAAVGRVRYIYRGLTVQPPQRQASPGRLQMQLYSAYLLRTALQQKASIRFRDGSLLHLNQQTDAVLRSAHLTYVSRGEVDQVVSPGTNHRIQTSATIAAAIGTEFDVRIVGSVSIITVVEGVVRVGNKAGTVLVKTGQQTAVAPGRAPRLPVSVNAQAVTSWTASIPPPPQPVGQNLALDANGGSVVGSSSALGPKQSGGLWSPRFINDGRLGFGWATQAGQVTNQWVRLRLPGAQQYLISAVIIDPAATHHHPASADLKDFEIRVSTTGIRATDFSTIYQGTAAQHDSLQRFSFSNPVAARYVELYALTNYGSGNWLEVAEFEVVGTLAPGAAKPPAGGGWSITLKANNTHPAQGATVVLTAAANRSTENTDYIIKMVDATNGYVYDQCGGSRVCTLKVPFHDVQGGTGCAQQGTGTCTYEAVVVKRGTTAKGGNWAKVAVASAKTTVTWGP